MPKLNISEAARAAGVSRPVIYKKIKNGELTSEPGEQGGKLIDTAELIRVFGELATPGEVSTPVNNLQEITHDITGVLQHQIQRLEEENGRLQAQIDTDRQQHEQTVEDLRQDRDAWRSQAEKQTLLLTQAQDQQAPRPTFWKRLFGA